MQEKTFRYRLARLPVTRALLEEVNGTAAGVHRKISRIDLGTVGISEYNQRYIRSKMNHPCFDWSINVYMLTYLLSHLSVPRHRSVLVDYGGGSGFISFLAKALGIGTVVYADI